ncbi:hypothetical protein [Sinomonas cyclohexanicum]|uniref:hypothetical protein n=1 Tax=Sinomonas cyclohexanicum TaxID=322009 RepID=UPI001E3C8FDD|nr:hypothetical protein [Corynebacterium cyclohexanicum]
MTSSAVIQTRPASRRAWVASCPLECAHEQRGVLQGVRTGSVPDPDTARVLVPEGSELAQVGLIVIIVPLRNERFPVAVPPTCLKGIAVSGVVIEDSRLRRLGALGEEVPGGVIRHRFG